MTFDVTAPQMTNLIGAFAGYLREERMLGAATIKRYRHVLEELEGFLRASEPGAPHTLTEADPSHLRVFLRHYVDETASVSRSTWNLRLAALRSFYSHLQREGLVEDNPALKIERIKTRPKERVPLSLDEYLALVNAMDQSPRPYRTRNRAIVHVFYHSALRVAEVASLDLSQVDFTNHKLLDVRTKGGKWLSADVNDLVIQSV